MTALGLCDGTPAWWALWTDAITRAPRFDDEDTDDFAVARGLDPVAVRMCFSDAWLAPDALRDPRAATGPLVRWPYRYEGGPAPTDSCRYGDGLCDGSCGG